MKIILAFVLTLCLFACKEKEETPAITPGLVGTYQKTYTANHQGIFQDILSDYNNFQETTTAIVSQTGTDTYTIKIQIAGIAKKNNANPLNYHLTADVSTDKSIQNLDASVMNFSGEYSSIFPTSTYLSSKKIYLQTKFKNGFLVDIMVSTSYRNDPAFFLIDTLPKIR